jgi:hypothetical protein
MDDSALRDYFLRPSCPSQRQYEALRAVFVEGLSQKDVAQRFGYSYGALRQLVLEFRSTFSAGDDDDSAPPFSTKTQGAARAGNHKGRSAPTSRPSPTSAV